MTSETPDSEINPWLISIGAVAAVGILALTIYKAVKWAREKVKSRDSIDSDTDSSVLFSVSDSTEISEEIKLSEEIESCNVIVMGELTAFL